MARTCWYVTGAIVAVVFGVIGNRLVELGALTTIVPVDDESNCSVVRGGIGLEDIATMRLRDGRAIVFAGSDTRSWIRGTPGFTSVRDTIRAMTPAEYGFIVALDLSLPLDKRTLVRVPLLDYPAGRAFLPHGLSIVEHDTGRFSLFVITHNADGDCVNRFGVKLDPTTQSVLALTYEDSVLTPLFTSLNDVTALGRHSFYATNFGRYAADTFSALAEMILNPGWHNVIFCTHSRANTNTNTNTNTASTSSSSASSSSGGWTCTEAIEGLYYPNGIASTPSGNTIYIAEMMASRLLVCDRNPTDGTLHVRQRIPMIGADNIELDAVNSRLTIGCHPSLIRSADAAHRTGPGSPRAPSQILSVPIDWRSGNVTGGVSELFLSAGAKLTAVSVGAVINRELVIGSFGKDDGLLVCSGF